MDNHGLNQAKHARVAGIEPSRISLVMNSRRKPGKDNASDIAKALHVPSEKIFRKAGLLPEINQRNEKIEELIYFYNLLPENEQDHIIRHIQATVTLLEQDGKLRSFINSFFLLNNQNSVFIITPLLVYGAQSS